MHDFKERLEAAVVRGLWYFDGKVTVEITEVSNRYPIPVDDDQARTCKGSSGIFDERYKGRTFYAIQVYGKDERPDDDLGVTCSIIFRTLNLGSFSLGNSEGRQGGYIFPVEKTAEVYRHLPPIEAIHTA